MDASGKPSAQNQRIDRLLNQVKEQAQGGDPEAALETSRELRKLILAEHGPDSVELVEVLAFAGWLQLETNDPQAAELSFITALTKPRAPALAPEHNDPGPGVNNLTLRADGAATPPRCGGAFDARQ